jgi:hypothetical protein
LFFQGNTAKNRNISGITVPFREANMALVFLPQVFPKYLFESARGYWFFSKEKKNISQFPWNFSQDL